MIGIGVGNMVWDMEIGVWGGSLGKGKGERGVDREKGEYRFFPPSDIRAPWPEEA